MKIKINIKREVIILVCLLILIPSVIYLFATIRNNLATPVKKPFEISTKTYPEASDYPYLAISEIYDRFWNKNSLSPGYYNTEGYVQRVGCNSDPCFGDEIAISEKNRNLSDSYRAKELLNLSVEHSNQFQVGKKYKFSLNAIDTINFPSSNPNASRVKVISLFGYSLIK